MNTSAASAQNVLKIHHGQVDDIEETARSVMQHQKEKEKPKKAQQQGEEEGSGSEGEEAEGGGHNKRKRQQAEGGQQDFKKLKVDDLKGACRRAGLPFTGKKAELVGRLEGHYKN